MNGEVTYALDFGSGGRDRRKGNAAYSRRRPQDDEDVDLPIPRIARLMALAIRFERLVQGQTIGHYAELALLGRVTRARLSQIMKLLHLAPDIQEQLLFLSPGNRLNERNLRVIVRCVDWEEQRHAFRKIMEPAGRA